MAESFGGSPLRAVGARLPDGLQRAIVDTPLHEVYLHARKHTARLEPVEFETEGGTIVIDGPTESYRRDNGDLYEPILTRELLSVLGPEDVFYDVGAHHGIFTELARVAGVEESAVHSFEGDTFNEYVLSHNVGDAPVNVTGEFVGTGDGMCSIDDYADRHRAPTVVKIDVEGAERDVLESMRSTLTEHSVTLYVEIHPSYLPEFGDSVADVQSLLTDAGYEYDLADHRSADGEWTDVRELSDDDDGYMLRARPAGAE